MLKIFYSRRTFITTLVVLCITIVGIVNHIDVTAALSTIALGMMGSNAAEGILTAKKGQP